MRTSKKVCRFLSAALLLSVLSGCGSNAPSSSVQSRPNVDQAEPAERNDASAEEYGVFETKDGVSVHLADIGSDTEAWELPAVEVTPHEFTAEDARRIAEALFGDAVYYEHRGSGVHPMTKAVIEEKTALWEELLAPGALEAIYGDQPELIADTRETIALFIGNARAAYDAAPETEERAESDWSFHPWEYYAGMTDYTPDGNESIEVDTVYRSIPYTLSVTNRRSGDYLLNSLFVYPFTGYITPGRVEENLFTIEHSQESRPTNEQLESARDRAKELLYAFGLGDWEIDRCAVKELPIDPAAPRYAVEVTAVPVFDGAAVTRQTQLSGLRGGTEDGLNWYYPDANFVFGADNTLLHLELQSPFDVVKTESLGTISAADAAAALQSGVEEKNLRYIFLTAGTAEQDLYIYQMKTGYSRVGAQDGSGRFWFVPSVTAMAALRDETVFGEPLDTSDPEALYPLLTVSLLDGSVIPTQIA